MCTVIDLRRHFGCDEVVLRDVDKGGYLKEVGVLDELDA